MITGEFGPREPVEEVLHFYDMMKAPAELWLLYDQHHNGAITQKSRSLVRVRLAARALQRETHEPPG